ncbi:EGF-like domain-containing protein [Giardia muris]|uniref:EGF-like domain-containing protein n=1 Tax=Giardia muris TaxID=5742 RepID=A0A4Z1TB82_GIAMU|nr:EGF-like domain-containing protein [Giardia muris]|eukprot:TNJ30507.1 EGF-like domain-containing protein [Giardia muris]
MFSFFIVALSACPPGFDPVDEACVPTACVTRYPGDRVAVCSGIGSCLIVEFGRYGCSCPNNTLSIGSECLPRACLTGGSYANICSGHGICFNGTCVCNDGYYGESCNLLVPECMSGEVFAQDGCYPMECVLQGRTCSILEHLTHGFCIRSPTPHCICGPKHVLHPTALCIPIACLIEGEPCSNCVRNNEGDWTCR